LSTSHHERDSNQNYSGNKGVVAGKIKHCTITATTISQILCNQSHDGKPDAGKSYIVFGKQDTDVINLSAIVAGTGGFVINGESAGDWSGCSVSSAGDVNGDGLEDFIVGAFGSDPSGKSYAGKSCTPSTYNQII
jgi:hypothetical protein